MHRELYAEHADLYGANVAVEDRALPRRSPTPSTRRASARARATASASTELLDGARPARHADAARSSPRPSAGRARAARLADAADVAVQRARRTRAGAPVRPGGGRSPGLGPDRRPPGRRRARARGRARCSSTLLKALAPQVPTTVEKHMFARLLTLLALAAVVARARRHRPPPLRGADRPARVPPARRRARRTTRFPRTPVLRVGAVRRRDAATTSSSRPSKKFDDSDDRLVDRRPRRRRSRSRRSRSRRAAVDDRAARTRSTPTSERTPHRA